MATGGQDYLSRSKLGGSDETLDHNCSLCAKINRNKEAVNYCVECQEYMCSSCVESHNVFPALARHVLLNPSQSVSATGGTSPILPSVPTEKCKHHPAKLMDMYCENHDTVGCSVCFNKYHKVCQDTHYIPDFILGKTITGLTALIHKLSKLIRDISLFQKRRESAREELKKKKAAYRKDIVIFRREINRIIDQLEQASLDELDIGYDELERKLNDEITVAKEILDEMAKRRDELQILHSNPSQEFVSAKICKDGIQAADDMLSMDIQNSFTLPFTRNNNALQVLKKVDSLGTFLMDKRTNRIPQTTRSSAKKQFLYKAHHQTSLSVKLQSDEYKCDISSLCILDSGDILLADYENNQLKRFSKMTYTCQDSMTCTTNPLSVCKVSDVEAAAALGTSKTIQFVSTKSKLTPTRSYKMSYQCYGVAAIGDQMYISNLSHVYVYGLDGKKKKTIHKDHAKEEIFSCCNDIAASDDGKRIYCTDGDKGLITLDNDGNVIWKYSGPGLKNAWGVCTDGQGNLFVTGKDSHNVIQIGPDGQYVGEVVAASRGIRNIQAICFDKTNSRLVVAGGDGNDNYVFDF